MFYLIRIRRERENLWLHIEQLFAIKTDAIGGKFVYQAADELDKNHRRNDNTDDTTGEGRMYENDGPFCPVKAFELYLAKIRSAFNFWSNALLIPTTVCISGRKA